jgi:hypothetical protein
MDDVVVEDGNTYNTVGWERLKVFLNECIAYITTCDGSRIVHYRYQNKLYPVVLQSVKKEKGDFMRVVFQFQGTTTETTLSQIQLDKVN